MGLALKQLPSSFSFHDDARQKRQHGDGVYRDMDGYKCSQTGS